MSKQKRRSSPVSRKETKPFEVGQVGILFVLAGNRVLIESSQLSEAELCAGFVNYPRSHEEYWRKLQDDSLAPQDEDYVSTPRGRSVFSVQSGRYLLFLDRCILRKPKLVREICRRLNLPIRCLQISSDDHYRCSGCLEEAE